MFLALSYSDKFYTDPNKSRLQKEKHINDIAQLWEIIRNVSPCAFAYLFYLQCSY